MTPERAAQIREAFGPCTVVYEAMTVEEIVAGQVDFDEKPMTEAEWIATQLTVEAVDHERSGSGGTQRWIAEIKARLRAAGIRVPKGDA